MCVCVRGDPTVGYAIPSVTLPGGSGTCVEISSGVIFLGGLAGDVRYALV